VTVTKDESVLLSRRYCARLSNAERIGRLMPVPVDVPDTFGATVTEAIRVLDASFEAWRQEHPPERTGR
jgi:hypothetical protein